MERFGPSSLACSVESSLSKRCHVKNYLVKDGEILDKVNFIVVYNKKKARGLVPYGDVPCHLQKTSPWVGPGKILDVICSESKTGHFYF